MQVRSVKRSCEARLKMFLASFADTNLRMSLIPDSFFISTSPLRYFASGTSPGSCAKSGLCGAYSGTLRSFLACASMRLSSTVTTMVLPSLQAGKRLQTLFRSLRILRGAWSGWSPQRARLVASTKSRSRQQRVKYLWQRSLVYSWLRLDQTATSMSARRLMKRWLSSSLLPLRLLTCRCLQLSPYWMGDLSSAWSTALARGLLRWNIRLFSYIITRNFLADAAILYYIQC